MAEDRKDLFPLYKEIRHEPMSFLKEIKLLELFYKWGPKSEVFTSQFLKSIYEGMAYPLNDRFFKEKNIIK